MKLAMIKVHNAIKQTGLPGKLILQVHDELILEVKENAAEDAVKLLKREMEGAYPSQFRWLWIRSGQELG